MVLAFIYNFIFNTVVKPVGETLLVFHSEKVKIKPENLLKESQHCRDFTSTSGHG